MSMIMLLERVSACAPVEQESTPGIIRFPRICGWGDGTPFDEDREDTLSLEKAWHGLHFLLSGDPWAGQGPLAFLLAGGVEEGEDLGYGPARSFDPDEVRRIAKALAGVSPDDLWSRFDPQAMADADIYGAHWTEEPEDDLQEEYLDYYEMLQEFVASAAEDGDSLRIVMA